MQAQVLPEQRLARRSGGEVGERKVRLDAVYARPVPEGQVLRRKGREDGLPGGGGAGKAAHGQARSRGVEQRFRFLRPEVRQNGVAPDDDDAPAAGVAEAVAGVEYGAQDRRTAG